MSRVAAFVLLLAIALIPRAASAQLVGTHARGDLTIARDHRSLAAIVIASDAGPWERRAAADLQKYIALMSGATPVIAAPGSIPGSRVAIVIGSAALGERPELAAVLSRTAKKHPVVQADAIAALRVGNRLYLAGSNDESQYFAVSWLLQQWGCRWYLPTDLGEVVPDHPTLTVGQLDFAYAPPFEIRHYWLAWNGDTTGADDFRHRNFMSAATVPGAGQALDLYTADIAPAGGTAFNVPFSAPATAAHIAAKIAPDYRAGKDVSLAIADGVYANDDPGDRALTTEYDRAFLRPSLTDAMMTLYNRVAGQLRRDYPASTAKIGGLAYVNVTQPPRVVTSAEPNLTVWIAPIDVDPNHAIDDPRSPPRQAYGHVLEGWARVMQGRVAVYDYDQAMLVWRDLPDPSHEVFARDVKIYARLGILGVGTESRGAFATTFLNLFFRGQLMWNPDADTGALLKAFYPGFYGPAGPAMANYWGAIFTAWRETESTEHEALASPAIYTPQLVAQLAAMLGRAEAALARAKGRAGRNEAAYAERLRFTRLSFELIRAYVAMGTAAATEADYPAAVAAGDRALAVRLELAKISPILTTRVVGPLPEQVSTGAAWFPGEVAQYRGYAALTDGTRGELVARLPLRWAFQLRASVPADWRYTGPVGGAGPCAGVPWRGDEQQVRSDIYLQGQAVLRPGRANDLGDYCYRTAIDVGAEAGSGKLHLMFPGLFNEAWLYIDGKLVANRRYLEPWWMTDYRLDWDVDVTGRLGPGRHEIVLGGFNPHHFAGMFRRPFLYRATP